jgi:aldehyde reductase
MKAPPAIGLGTWKAPKTEVLVEAIRYAVEEAGYRHIDCAACYGNEAVVGQAISDLMTRGVVKREELWITSKLWCTRHRPDLVEVGVRQTLADLKIDYLDLYLIHHAASFVITDDDNQFPRDDQGAMRLDKVPLIDTWRAMERLVDIGLVRYIGVSNFTIAMLERIRYAPGVKIQPFVNQIEFHLYMQQEPLRQYLSARGILLEGYSPLGSGDFRKPDEPVLLEDEELNAVAKELNQQVGSVALKFLQQISGGATLLVKSVTPARIQSNIHLDGIRLTDEQIERLKRRERCYRFVDVRRLWRHDVCGDEW